MKSIVILICSLICTSNYVLGYELKTHEEISMSAAELSVLRTNPKILQNLGLSPWGQNIFSNGEEVQKKVSVFVIGDGARFEDNTPRYFNHFYDPTNGFGLNGLWNGIPSPNWAVDETGNFWPASKSDQDFSLKDAHDYLYKALTLPDITKRENNFGLLFRTLGHVTHHIGDMAQPQHTRDDGHATFDNKLYKKYI